MRKCVILALLLIGTLPLSGCGGHLGDPVSAGIGKIGEELTYGARRRKVVAFVEAHYPAMVREIRAGGTDLLWRAMDIAGAPPAERQKVFNEVRGNPEVYLNGNRTALVALIMVHTPAG